MTTLLYLLWYLVVLALAVVIGAAYLLLLYPLTGGRWMEALRPGLRRICATAWLPILGLLGLLFVFPRLAYWPDPADAHLAELVAERAAFLNWPGFLARTAVYLLGLLAIWRLGRVGGQRGQAWAAPALIGLTLGTFFFVVDWVMVRSPEWFSTAFPFTYMLLGVAGALALNIATLRLPEVEPAARRQLASLLQASVLVTAYLAIAELVVIWMGDLPREARFYVTRSHGLGPWLLAYVVLAGVAFPFLSLLPRKQRIQPARLRRAALLAASGVATYLFWFFHPFSPTPL